MKLKSKILAAICLTAMSAPMAQAQLSPEFAETSNLQARATLTIPFGGQRKSTENKPKFALGFRSETARTNLSDWALRPSSESLDVREFNLALTLEDAPTFLLNDQIILSTDRLAADAEKAKSGALDTYDKTVLTVIGVSLAVIAGSIIILSD